ncbi:flavodoxin family protein [Alkalilimnicola ehrlichii]|nr:flavodoxin family protein [Alkalilimnicola ehrlichii]
MKSMSQRKRLLIVAHAPSPNTEQLVNAVLRGARHPDIDNVEALHIPPLEANADDVLNADGIILGTTENLGYMSGALKDFFDRIYYPCLEHTEGLPYALYVRAGHDGTGTRRAVDTIVTGLRWRAAQDPLILRGKFENSFIEQCEELGMYLAAGLDAGIL